MSVNPLFKTGPTGCQGRAAVCPWGSTSAISAIWSQDSLQILPIPARLGATLGDVSREHHPLHGAEGPGNGQLRPAIGKG